MSYARSPRPLCSITIGIKPSPFGSSFQPLLIVCSPASLDALSATFEKKLPGAPSRGRRLHQCRESYRLIGYSRALQHPVDHVAFDRPYLVFVQAIGLLVMPPDHRLRLLETLCRFLDQCPDLFRSRLQLMLADDLVQHETER